MAKIRVGFDLSQAAFTGGVATYTKELAQHLQMRPEVEMKWLYNSLRRPYSGGLTGVTSWRIPPSVLEPMMNRWRMLNVEQLLGEVDVFHSSDWTQPKTKAKKVTTIHDVVTYKYPEWSVPKVVKVHQRRLKLVEQEVDKVIVVSESVKHDLLEVSQIPESKIVVVYEGVNERFKPQSAEMVQDFRQKMKLPDKFILGVGGVGSRRNLEAAKQASGELPFIVTGQDLPHLSDEQMPLLYAAAELLLYPSFYEGFGLPILEAMSVGTPVVTSNIGAMAEVAGAAAVLVDPKDLNSIKEGVKIAQIDRDGLVKSGLRQAKKFSWEIAAEQTVKVYEDLAK